MKIASRCIIKGNTAHDANSAIIQDETNSIKANKKNAFAVRSTCVSSNCWSKEEYDKISFTIPVVTIVQLIILISVHMKSVLSISSIRRPIYTEVGIKSINHSAFISFKNRWFSNIVTICEVRYVSKSLGKFNT